MAEKMQISDFLVEELLVKRFFATWQVSLLCLIADSREKKNFARFGAILYNLKNMENTHGEVLLLVKLQA